MSIGVTRNLSSKYVEYKRNYTNNNSKRISLNDSGQLLNDNGRTK
jgi:hypothetical protein